MPNPREKRLEIDQQKVQQLALASGGRLRLVSVSGRPPHKFVIEYNCPSLVKGSNGEVSVRNQHRVEISLDGNYPITKPSARMLTPVFNPHVFITQSICLGGRWTPTETLDALVLRIGAILQLDPKVIDYRSLANAEAGEWAKKNPSKLPLPGAVDFKAPEKPEGRIQWS